MASGGTTENPKVQSTTGFINAKEKFCVQEGPYITSVREHRDAACIFGLSEGAAFEEFINGKATNDSIKAFDKAFSGLIGEQPLSGISESALNALTDPYNTPHIAKFNKCLNLGSNANVQKNTGAGNRRTPATKRPVTIWVPINIRRWLDKVTYTKPYTAAYDGNVTFQCAGDAISMIKQLTKIETTEKMMHYNPNIRNWNDSYLVQLGWKRQQGEDFCQLLDTAHAEAPNEGRAGFVSRHERLVEEWTKGIVALEGQLSHARGKQKEILQRKLVVLKAKRDEVNAPLQSSGSSNRTTHEAGESQVHYGAMMARLCWEWGQVMAVDTTNMTIEQVKSTIIDPFYVFCQGMLSTCSAYTNKAFKEFFDDPGSDWSETEKKFIKVIKQYMKFSASLNEHRAVLTINRLMQVMCYGACDATNIRSSYNVTMCEPVSCISRIVRLFDAEVDIHSVMKTNRKSSELNQILICASAWKAHLQMSARHGALRINHNAPTMREITDAINAKTSKIGATTNASTASQATASQRQRLMDLIKQQGQVTANPVATAIVASVAPTDTQSAMADMYAKLQKKTEVVINKALDLQQNSSTAKKIHAKNCWFDWKDFPSLGQKYYVDYFIDALIICNKKEVLDNIKMGKGFNNKVNGDMLWIVDHIAALNMRGNECCDWFNSITSQEQRDDMCKNMFGKPVTTGKLKMLQYSYKPSTDIDTIKDTALPCMFAKTDTGDVVSTGAASFGLLVCMAYACWKNDGLIGDLSAYPEFKLNMIKSSRV